eukprot:scaffold523556_cov44-Prasinocladus_malaysianus.AAC.1
MKPVPETTKWMTNMTQNCVEMRHCPGVLLRSLSSQVLARMAWSSLVSSGLTAQRCQYPHGHDWRLQHEGDALSGQLKTAGPPVVYTCHELNDLMGLRLGQDPKAS